MSIWMRGLSGAKGSKRLTGQRERGRAVLGDRSSLAAIPLAYRAFGR